MSNLKSTLFPDEAAIERYIDALGDSEPLASIDLIDANPDVRAQLGRRGGIYIIEVHKVSLAGKEYFVARIEDGGSGDLEDEVDELEIFDNEADARDAADEMILQWKENWGMRIL